MKATITLRLFICASALFLLSATSASAQQYQLISSGRDGQDTVTTTRIINSYSKVKAVSGNVVYTNGPYVPQARDRVLLIQMTGRDSGVWQWDTVRIGGNPCFLSNIYKPFDTASGAKIQIIKVPQYQSLYIRRTGVLTAAPWNDSTGGVLTFMVRDTFKMDSAGRCDVSYLGFLPRPDTSAAGAYGAGGVGGAGGAIGQNGGDSALVIGSGVGGGGDGGMYGQYGAAGDTVLYAHCPGCATAIYRDTATNLSLVDSGLGKNKFLMGGAGRTGHGGKGGRGGGGGGGGTAGPGTNGGHGGAGGRGGSGGRGGGIILFSAGYMANPDSTLLFFALGENGYNGMPGDTGEAGGNGGPGLGPCSTGGPGGGGRGASGGNGGDGGGGGGGGVVYGVLFHRDSAFNNRTYTTAGGMRGHGGQGGPGGPGGHNGTTPGGGNCSGAIAGNGPNGDNGNDGNNGNNGTGSGGNSGGGGSSVISPCSNTTGIYQNIEVGYGCTTQGYLPYFEEAATGYGPVGYYSEDTFSSDYYTNYSVMVIDASGCMKYYAGQVSQPIFTPTYELTPSCPGMSNGGIRVILDVYGNYNTPAPCVQPVGHTAIYDINGNFLDSTDAGLLSSGPYYVAWWINNDPVHYDTLQMEDVQAVSFTEAIMQPTCSQPDGGSIHLQATGENLCVFYNYVWSNQANGLDLDNLLPGIYDLSVHYDGPSYCGQVANVYYDNNYLCAQTFSYTIDPPVGTADVYLDVDVCPGMPYTYNGIDYYAGTNVILPANPGGCDTTVWLTVNEYYSPQGYEHQQICDGDAYYWNGAYYSQTGQYHITLYGADALGCDSIAELDLTVLPPITAGNLADQSFGEGCVMGPDYSLMNITGGDGYYTYNYFDGTSTCIGSALQTPYTVDVTDLDGCSAEFYVNLNYQQDNYSVSIDNTTPENCPNASDGTVSYTVFNIDNVQCNNFYVYLDFNGPNGYSQSVSVLPYQVSYTDYNLPAGTYYYNVSGGGVCSSVVQGIFTIGTSTAGAAGSEYDTICDHSSILWNGTTYAQAGIYTYTVTGGSSSGCDSTATLYLTVAPTYASDWYDTIYSGQSVTLGAQQYSAEGTYTASLTAATGCDSTVTLYLTVLQSTAAVTTYLTQNICAGASYTVGIHTYTNPGFYTDTLGSIAGGDSIIYLTLSVTQPVTGSAAASICAGSSYTWGGSTYTQAGSYTHTFTAVSGCDSIVTLTLNVTQPVTGIATASICAGSSYTWGGSTYTQAGSYTHTFAAVSGCDSIVTLTLNVTQPVTGIATASICAGSSYTWGGSAYTQAGSYTHTFTASSGCDSIVTLTLSVTQPVTGTATASICAGGSYSWGGNTYTQAGSYTHTFTAASGCDSIVTLTLSIANGVNTTLSDTICQGESYTAGHSSYTASGTYTDIFTGANGCDSVQTLYLTVLQPVTPSLVISVSHGPVINGQQIDTFRASYTACDGAFYSWYLNLQPVGLHDSLAVIAHFVNQADSIVCRIDCQNRCASTTYTYSNRIRSGLTDAAPFLHSVMVYPNPNTGTFAVEMNSEIAAIAQISLLDMIGQEVLTDQMSLHAGDNKHQVYLPESAASGVYILQLSVAGHIMYERVTVER